MTKYEVQGLYSGEDETVYNFCKLIEKEAFDRDAVFFVADMEGHRAMIGDVLAEDRSGWLVPADKAREFEPIWNDYQTGGGSWPNASEYFVWEEWSQSKNGNLAIGFNRY